MGLEAWFSKDKTLENGMHKFLWILDTNNSSITENTSVKEILCIRITNNYRKPKVNIENFA